MSELVCAIGAAMNECIGKDERRAALGRALELAEARETLDVQAHGVAYGHAVHAIECAARDEDGWLDISELESYEYEAILNDVAYLEARGLVVRHEEKREWIQILPEESVAFEKCGSCAHVLPDHFDGCFCAIAEPLQAAVLRAIPAAWVVSVAVELIRAKMHGETFASLHEAYAVILEELDEIWDVTRQKKRERNADELRKEFVQLAAMAFKAMASMGNFTGGKV